MSIGTNISNKLKSHLNIRKCTFLNDIPVNDKSIFLNPISTDEIKKYILNIKPACSFNRWESTNTILKATIFYILTPLQYIFNLVLTTGVFPHSFKNTIIIPLHKQLNKSDYTNYRPIALTITLSKVLEKCIKDRLYNFLETRYFPVTNLVSLETKVPIKL